MGSFPRKAERVAKGMNIAYKLAGFGNNISERQPTAYSRRPSPKLALCIRSQVQNSEFNLRRMEDRKLPVVMCANEQTPDDLQSKQAVSKRAAKVLPKAVEHFELIDGVWVAHPRCAMPVAAALRKSLMDVAHRKPRCGNLVPYGRAGLRQRFPGPVAREGGPSLAANVAG
jgi:hypothetical protein